MTRKRKHSSDNSTFAKKRPKSDVNSNSDCSKKNSARPKGKCKSCTLTKRILTPLESQKESEKLSTFKANTKYFVQNPDICKETNQNISVILQNRLQNLTVSISKEKGKFSTQSTKFKVIRTFSSQHPSQKIISDVPEAEIENDCANEVDKLKVEVKLLNDSLQNRTGATGSQATSDRCPKTRISVKRYRDPESSTPKTVSANEQNTKQCEDARSCKDCMLEDATNFGTSDHFQETSPSTTGGCNRHHYMTMHKKEVSVQTSDDNYDRYEPSKSSIWNTSEHGLLYAMTGQRNSAVPDLISHKIKLFRENSLGRGVSNTKQSTNSLYATSSTDDIPNFLKSDTDPNRYKHNFVHYFDMKAPINLDTTKSTSNIRRFVSQMSTTGGQKKLPQEHKYGMLLPPNRSPLKLLLVFAQSDPVSDAFSKAADKIGFDVTVSSAYELALEEYLSKLHDLVIIDSRPCQKLFDFDTLCSINAGLFLGFKELNKILNSNC